MTLISYRLLPRRGTEASRATGSGAILADEMNSTTDQQRLFLGDNLVAPVFHEAASAAARLALNSTAARGCWPCDVCKQTDTAPASFWICVSGNGVAASDWECISANGPVGVAAQALSGHRAMTFDMAGRVTYAQPGDVIVGITEHAFESGSLVTMRDSGVITESSWTWTEGGTVFLSADGVLTQSVPQSGYQNVIGRAVSATSILLQITPTIKLAG